MKKGLIAIIVLVAIAAIALMWGSGKYNSLVKQDENVKKAWANVETDYQRRYDLIGNLVATVDNAAEFEKGTLTEVIEARSKAQAIQLSVEDLSEQNIQKFQQAQNELNQSFLGRLNFLQENYPQLTATEQFRDLNSQIEGTENRINLTRTRYNEAVNEYNNAVRTFPNNIVAGFAGFTQKAPFSAAVGAEKAPSVRDEFNK